MRSSKINHYRFSNAEPTFDSYPSPPSSLLMDKSSTLHSMIRSQASTLEELRKDVLGTSSRDEPSRQDSASQSTGWQEDYELASEHVWSDSDETSLPATSHGGSDIHDSIEAIREEASRVDAAIALDQLHTMKEEMETLKKELNTRDTAIKDLRSIMQVKDSRLSTLELERDLYKADAGCEESESDEEPEIVHSQSSSSSQSVGELIEAFDRRSKLGSQSTESASSGSRIGATPPRRNTVPNQTPTRPRADLHDLPSSSRSMDDRSNVKAAPIVHKLSTPDHQSLTIVRDTNLASPVRSEPHHLLPRSRSPSPSVASHLSKPKEPPAQTVYRGTGQSPFLLVPRTRSNEQINPTLHLRDFDQNHRVPGQHIRRITNPPMEEIPTPIAEARHYIPPETRASPYLLVPTPLSPTSPRFAAYGEHPINRSITPATTQSADDISLSSRNSKRHTRPHFRRGPWREDLSVQSYKSHEQSAGSRSRKPESTTQPSSFDSGTGTKSCLPIPKMFLRRKKKNASHSQPDPSRSYQTHAGELTQMLRASLETSEELRKRLATISTYYESVVEELQQNLDANDVERKKMEHELEDQIASLEQWKLRDVKRGAPSSRGRQRERLPPRWRFHQEK